jgi:hypothetical protein
VGLPKKTFLKNESAPVAWSEAVTWTSSWFITQFIRSFVGQVS